MQNELEARDSQGRTPLHLAVLRQSKSEVRQLLKRGAPVDTQQNDGSYPLHSAAAHINIGIAALLLEYSADPNVLNKKGETPFHMARRNSRMMELFAMHNGLLSIQDDSGNTPLHLYLQSKQIDYEITAKLLKLESADVNLSNNAGSTPFHILITKPHHYYLGELVMKFIDRGVDIFRVTKDGKLPFDIYVNKYLSWNSGENAEVSECFLRNGADPNTKLGGEPLLHKMLPRIGQSSTIDSILKRLCRYSNVDDIGSTGNSALHEVAQNCQNVEHGVLFEILIERGANPNQLNRDGRTPLSLLCRRDKNIKHIIEFAKLLLDQGANPFLPHEALPVCDAAIYHEGDTQKKLVKLILARSISYAQQTTSLPYSENDPASQWWRKWVLACQAGDDWTRAKAFLTTDNSQTRIHEIIPQIALEVIADKCIESNKNNLQNQPSSEQRSRAERNIVLILQDCRAEGIAMAESWYDLTLELLASKTRASSGYIDTADIADMDCS
jgi:ankyrin repeat protein